MNGPGTHRAIWSGTAFMKSVTATVGPPPPFAPRTWLT
jgi:hypothetical protein